MKIVYKEKGKTPLECLNSINNTEKKTYVGRLDPMAEGLLLVLEGEECKESKKYRKLDKTYEYKFILGIETDSFDTLGIVTSESTKEISEDQIKKITNSIVGDVSFPYPVYSSQTVNGIALFRYAQEGTLDTISIPDAKTKIYSNSVIDIKEVDIDDLKKEFLPVIKKINGDFRIKEIEESWNKIKNRKVIQVHAKATVSSGTYIRSIVDHIGNSLGTGALTTEIIRTQIGKWDKPYGQ